jgi:hypothetical protein
MDDQMRVNSHPTFGPQGSHAAASLFSNFVINQLMGQEGSCWRVDHLQVKLQVWN